MIDIWTRAVLVGAAVSVALLLAFAATWLVGLMRRTPWLSLAVTLFFSGVAVMYSGAKSGSTNEPPRGSVELRVESVELRGGQSHNSTLSTFNSQFRLESVGTNAAYSYAMPSNGVRHEKWWRRGAYEDIFRLDLGGMRFPLGTNLCDHLWTMQVFFL